jgi:putative membrane protein
MAGWAWLVMIPLWAGAIVFIAWATRNSGSSASPNGEAPRAINRNGAQAILDERFARGEIDTDEYRERKQALRGRR